MVSHSATDELSNRTLSRYRMLYEKMLRFNRVLRINRVL